MDDFGAPSGDGLSPAAVFTDLDQPPVIGEDGQDLSTTEDQPDNEADDTLALVRRWHEAAPGDARESLWGSLSDDEREALSGVGIGLISLAEDDAFRPLGPQDADYGSAVARAKGEVAAGMAAIRRGELDLTSEAREAIEALVDEAEALPDNGLPLQRAAALIATARSAQVDAQPFGPVVSTTWSTTADGGQRVIEEDPLGRRRETVFSPAESDTARREQEAYWAADRRPWTGRESQVTLDEVLSWPYLTQAKFLEEHPKEAERMRHLSSLRMGELDPRSGQ